MINLSIGHRPVDRRPACRQARRDRHGKGNAIARIAFEPDNIYYNGGRKALDARRYRAYGRGPATLANRRRDLRRRSDRVHYAAPARAFTFGTASVAKRLGRDANPATATIRKRTGSSSPRLAAAIISIAISSRTTSGWVVQ